MKYTINGREYMHFQLSNNDIIQLLEGDTLTSEQREELTNKVIERFKYSNCPHRGENEDNVFVRQFSDFVNGKCISKQDTAKLMANDHRYLQNEMFKICLEYIKILADNFDKKQFDPRNQYACTAAKHMIDGLKNADYPY